MRKKADIFEGVPIEQARKVARGRQSIPDGSKFDDLRAADLACTADGDPLDDGEEPLFPWPTPRQ